MVHLKRFAARLQPTYYERGRFLPLAHSTPNSPTSPLIPSRFPPDVCTKITTEVQFPERLNLAPFVSDGTDGGEGAEGGDDDSYHMVDGLEDSGRVSTRRGTRAGTVGSGRKVEIPGNTNYTLIGVINHHEKKLSSDYGRHRARVFRHYTAYARAVDGDGEGEAGAETSGAGDWVEFDDARCKPVLRRDVLGAGASAYILFYQLDHDQTPS